MTKLDPPIERVPCEIFMKEVPKSEAIIPEACDYVAYFCGLECYTQWRRQSQENVAQGRLHRLPSSRQREKAHGAHSDFPSNKRKREIKRT
ncbi:hypothetical protein AEMCBJ_08675 [Cupriavidus necator]|uniref:DUF3330 domain-containing protein n=1 Tax=Cupriavidus necator TaxID=106590 RepID=UPI003F73E143